MNKTMEGMEAMEAFYIVSLRTHSLGDFMEKPPCPSIPSIKGPKGARDGRQVASAFAARGRFSIGGNVGIVE